eukprot:2609161-Amphidinium_carterae.1
MECAALWSLRSKLLVWPQLGTLHPCVPGVLGVPASLASTASRGVPCRPLASPLRPWRHWHPVDSAKTAVGVERPSNQQKTKGPALGSTSEETTEHESEFDVEFDC